MLGALRHHAAHDTLPAGRCQGPPCARSHRRRRRPSSLEQMSAGSELRTALAAKTGDEQYVIKVDASTGKARRAFQPASPLAAAAAAGPPVSAPTHTLLTARRTPPFLLCRPP